MNRRATLHRMEWNGILLEISYVPKWLSFQIQGEDLAHLEVQSIRPVDAPLPITETGYLSHFIAASAVAAAGGPVAYVDVWLSAESEAPAWCEREQAARQLDLF